MEATAQALSLLDPEPPAELGAEVVIPGKPRPWKRMGYNRRSGHFYVQDEDTAIRDGIAWGWKRGSGLHFGSDPVELEVEAVFDRPRSHYGTGRNQFLVRAAAPRFPGKNLGDLDNIVKGVKDALTGVAYNDDCQIVGARLSKRWAAAGEHAHLRIALRAL